MKDLGQLVRNKIGPIAVPEKFLVRRVHMQAGRAHLPHTPFKATSQVYPQRTPLLPSPPSKFIPSPSLLH